MSQPIHHTVAVEIFMRKSGMDAITARAYLPDAYSTCDKCIAFEGHEHPLSEWMTMSEIDSAVADAFMDEAEAERDRFIFTHGG